MKKLWITMALLTLILCLFVACGEDTPDNATEDSTTTTVRAFMAELPDEAPLSSLALPGTHDSGATVDMVLPGTAKCQSLTIGEQLSIGVRFFDIRLRRVEGSLHVYHGEVDQKLSFDEVLTAFYSFLDTYPTEAVIVCIKEEADPVDTAESFDAAIKRVLSENADRWYLENKIPTLGEARGKCVLMRRYGTAGSYGFGAASGWRDNTTFTIENPGCRLRVQDCYEQEAPEGKWEAIHAFFDTMAQKEKDTYYLNYTSGYVKNFLGIPNILTVSDYVTPKLYEALLEKPDVQGIFVSDHITQDLAQAIYELNFQ